MSCKAITAKGTRCSRKAVKSGCCSQHYKISSKKDKQVTKRSKKQSKKDKIKHKKKTEKKSESKKVKLENEAGNQIYEIVKEWKASNEKNNYKIEFDELESDQHYIEYDGAFVYIVDVNNFQIIYEDERFTQEQKLKYPEFVELYANILKYHPDASFTIIDED
jgi:hypothetical protein